jgi:hypothetical protein
MAALFMSTSVFIAALLSAVVIIESSAGGSPTQRYVANCGKRRLLGIVERT